MWAKEIGMIDTGRSKCSLSVLLSAMEICLRAQTALEIELSECRQQLLVCTFEHRIYQPELLFEGSVYFTQSSRLRGLLLAGLFVFCSGYWLFLFCLPSTTVHKLCKLLTSLIEAALEMRCPMKSPQEYETVSTDKNLIQW